MVEGLAFVNFPEAIQLKARRRKAEPANWIPEIRRGPGFSSAGLKQLVVV